ncbi:MAG: hypothetical protein Q8Q33_01375, partial [Chlamydiota bacterium]|nr:hypothetical protein [Chlamydiota bacterium]
MKKRRLFRYIKFILGILCILVSSIVLFISFSRTGLNWVGHYYINQTLSPRQCSIASINGNLLQGAVFENVAILEAKKIGRASDILIHHLKLQWHPWRKYPITMSGLDADILLTGQNKLHISGSYANDTFQLKCSSPRIPLENITKSETFPLKYLMGSFHNINMNIAGSLEKPLLSGIVQLEDFNLLRMFTLNGHISFKLYCDLQNSNPSLFGNITFNQLRFSFLKSIFSLDGRIRLHGPIDQAIIDISGTSQINGANIDIQINGPIQNINYQFGSDKALSAFQFITALIFKQDFYLEPGLIKGSMLQISKQIFLFACEKLFQNIIKELFHAELVTCDLPQFDAYQTVMLRNIVIHNSDYLPQNNTLSLEKLSFELWPLSSLTDSIMIENATLSIPGSEPLYINGLYRNKRLDAHLLSDKLSLTDVLSQSFPTLTSMIPAIEISALNIHVQASLDSINANGSFIIKSLSLDLMALHDASVIFDLEALIRNDIRLSGFTEFHHAVLKIGQHHIQIGQSKLVFDGDPLRPHLKLNAQTVIESQEITLTVDHKISDPDFTIHIEPESVTNKLPLILLSGKSWAQIQNMYQKSTSETVQ